MKALLLIPFLFFRISADLADVDLPEEAEAVTTFEMMVVADRVNLRNAGRLESDVIGQVNYGDMLMGLELDEEWVRVRPPEDMAVWVHGGLLFEDREVRSRVLNMRSGPGTQFDVLGQLERMDPVTVVDRYGEWRRIVPTDAVQVWIFRELVQITTLPDLPEDGGLESEAPVEDPEPEASAAAGETIPVEVVVEETVEEILEAPAEDAAAEVESVEVEVLPLSDVEMVPEEIPVADEEAETEAIAAPEDVNLVPLEGQGTASVRRGWVKAYLIAGSAPSRFQLVFRERGREEALAYLRGNEDEIRALVGRPVLVRGRDFWVAGQRVPLMRIESIEQVPELGQ